MTGKCKNLSYAGQLIAEKKNKESMLLAQWQTYMYYVQTRSNNNNLKQEHKTESTASACKFGYDNM